MNNPMGGLANMRQAQTRSISAENVRGEKGRGGMATEGTGAKAAQELGQKWKVAPCIDVQPGESAVLADVAGPGSIRHIWLTCAESAWRSLVLRMYWDGEEAPSVETPLGDFFCQGWCRHAGLSSLAVCVNPRGGLNCYWEMPFRRHAKITVEHVGLEKVTLFYQITYLLEEVAPEAAYFHAQYRRANPLPYKTDHVILDGVSGRGHYVGTYLAWGSNNNLWWGEGEIKFFMDGDGEFPTICGTGTEDYFCGAWCFEEPAGSYSPYCTPYAGLHQVLLPDGFNRSQQRFGMYRWHITDPVYFRQDLRVTIQALGWRSGGRYLPLQDDIASTAFWYQAEPHAAFPPIDGFERLEVI